MHHGKMTIKCHLNFIWTIKGLQLQLGQIRVQLGQIRVSPLFVQMKSKSNDKTAIPLHKTKQAYHFIKHILLLLFFFLFCILPLFSIPFFFFLNYLYRGGAWVFLVDAKRRFGKHVFFFLGKKMITEWVKKVII